MISVEKTDEKDEYRESDRAKESRRGWNCGGAVRENGLLRAA